MSLEPFPTCFIMVTLKFFFTKHFGIPITNYLLYTEMSKVNAMNHIMVILIIYP